MNKLKRRHLWKQRRVLVQDCGIYKQSVSALPSSLHSPHVLPTPSACFYNRIGCSVPTVLLSLSTPAPSESSHSSSSRCSSQAQRLCLCGSLCQERFSCFFTEKAYSPFTYLLKHHFLREACLSTCMWLLLPVTCSCGATRLSFRAQGTACNSLFNYTQNVCQGLSYRTGMSSPTGQGLACSLLYPQSPAQCLAHRRPSLNKCTGP